MMFHSLGALSLPFSANYALRDTTVIHGVPNKGTIVDGVTSNAVLTTMWIRLVRRTWLKNVLLR